MNCRLSPSLSFANIFKDINIFVSLAYSIVKVRYIIHVTYKCVLIDYEIGKVTSRLLATLRGSQKLQIGFDCAGSQLP